MGDRELTAGLVLALLLGAAGPAAAFEVTTLDPPPNYEPTVDPGDRAQLTDGRLQDFPFWTRRESVGWVNRTPVRIGTRAGNLPTGGTLAIRAAMQVTAGVFPPRRVDVYCRSGDQRQHVGEATHVRQAAEDGGVVDLAVPVGPCPGGDLDIVLHQDGPFVLIDELTLRPAAGRAAPPAGSSTKDPLADSLDRLEGGLLGSGRAAIRRALAASAGDDGVAWLSEPWGPLQVPARSGARQQLRVTVAAGTRPRYVVGIGNPGASARRYAVVPPAGAAVNALVPVLAADGQLVFDAVDPANPPAPGAAPGDVLYLLVTEAAGAPAGPREIGITDDQGWAATLRVDVDVLDRLRPAAVDQPRVLVWTYTNDSPIWTPRNAPALAASLAAAGVNVVDIHPAHIPAPLGEPDWPARRAALKADLTLFRGKALALLFLGGAPWDTLVSLPDDAASRRRLAAWVDVLKDVAREAGYGPDDWALYLVDEPRGEDLGRLATLITRLRAIDPALRFYANPSLGRGERVTALPALWKLKGLVDYWQPRAGPSFDAVATVLGAADRERLWMYDNPQEPARSTLPACYRALGSRAFDTGARGVGFWSFSATNDSSAWSDFDGRQPDWAVVYEAKTGFVSSRRWEAFQQGLADFAVLAYCARSGPGDAAIRGQCTAYRTALDAALRADCGPQ